MNPISILFLIALLFSPGETTAHSRKNRKFKNVRVKRTLQAKNAFVTGNLSVSGAINGSNVLQGPANPLENSVAIFAAGSGLALKSSTVLIDSSGNITINGITKNGNTVNWPSTIGAAGTYLGSDGAGNLVFGTPAGAGNVSTATPFFTNYAIIKTDQASGVDNVKQSGVLIDDSNNVTGINQLTATTINAAILGNVTGNLTGNADTATSATTSTSFSGSLAGNVTGPQGATVVSSVGGQPAVDVAAGSLLANDATSANTPSTIIRRDGSGDFSAGTIIANLTGNVTGNLTGNASTATSATSAATTTNFTGSLSGQVTGTQGATVVASVGGQSASSIANATTAANNATPTNTASTIVSRDSSNNFNAGTITANLIGNVTGNVTGNASTASSATTATDFTGPLIGDVIGNQGTTQVTNVGGQTATSIASATLLANAATSSDAPGELVRRDASGNFSAGTITANLIGNVTGNLTGNATSATSATSAATTTNFTGSLSGQVTGTQGATIVASVGGQSAAQVAAGVILANAATSNNTANTIVQRDNSSNFSTNMITINGTVTNPTDAATKSYVDTVAALGLTIKQPAIVVSTINIASLSGLQTIDGVLLVDSNRVLLVGQTDQTQNGLWVAHAGAWARPTDFASGPAGEAYVLILEGTINAGSSWVCNTPTATIGTNNITFAEFSLPSQTTGANVGSGAGQIFSDTTGVTLNFKTLSNGSHVVITNNANNVNIATDATSLNTINTIVARDGSGNFAASTITASLTGSASNNVLKAGDTMTGNLNLALQHQLQLQDGTGSGNFVGLEAPATVGTSYTVALPATAPTTGQYLQTTSASTTQWATIGGSPAATQAFYVAKNGNDSNNGSLVSPFLTIKQAVNTANGIASLATPIVINIGPGIFVEDNSGGALSITANGMSIVGSSTSSTIIVPTTLSVDLFNIATAYVQFSNCTLNAGASGSTANGITVNATAGEGGFQSMILFQFQTGLSLNGSVGSPILILDNILSQGNGTGVFISNMRIIIENSLFLGPYTGSIAANGGVSITGANALVTLLSNSFRLMTTGVSVTGGANMRVLGTNIETTTNGFACAGGSISALIGCNFILNNVNAVDISASGSSTNVSINGCLFQCNDASGTPQGTALQVTTGATMVADSCTIENAVLGIQCGTSGDTILTSLQANSVTLQNCTADIQQVGTSLMRFIGGVFDSNALSTVIANATNVSFAAFDITAGDTLALGNTTDSSQVIYEVMNGQAVLPNLVYKPSYYGSKGTVYINANANPTFNGTQSPSNSANYYLITGDRTQQTGINLISDTSGTIGSGSDVRGWAITKVGTGADLTFNYSNNDTSGQVAVGSNTVMQLNGVANQVEFPTTTTTPLPTNTTAKLVWGSDTNLYRSATNTLKTDGNLIIGGLAPNTALTSNSSNQITSSFTTNTELGYVSGVTSPIQTQLNNTLPTTGGTLTGPLQLSAGTTSAPSLRFTGSSTTGLSANGDNLSFSTAGSERLKISSLGTISINGLTPAGVVHNDATGNITTSLIVDADISSSAAISNSKLAPITTPNFVSPAATGAVSTNTPSAIVLRDAGGNFAAGTITANLTGNVAGNVTGNVVGSVTGAASLNVLKSGDAMSGILTLIAGSPAVPSIQFAGSTNTGISAGTTNILSFDTAGTEQMNISTAAITMLAKLILSNVLCNQAIQAVVPTNGGSVTVNSSTSILLLLPASTILVYTVTFPPNPTNGQLFTILLGTTNTINLTNSGGAGGALILNDITQLSLIAPGVSVGGTSVTYIYYSPNNNWLRYLRG